MRPRCKALGSLSTVEIISRSHGLDRVKQGGRKGVEYLNYASRHHGRQEKFFTVDPTILYRVWHFCNI